jgi:hypothetical protein
VAEMTIATAASGISKDFTISFSIVIEISAAIAVLPYHQKHHVEG